MWDFWRVWGGNSNLKWFHFRLQHLPPSRLLTELADQLRWLAHPKRPCSLSFSLVYLRMWLSTLNMRQAGLSTPGFCRNMAVQDCSIFIGIYRSKGFCYSYENCPKGRKTNLIGHLMYCDTILFRNTLMGSIRILYQYKNPRMGWRWSLRASSWRDTVEVWSCPCKF